MEDQALFYIGTYTQPILFGTGDIIQGKGRGIYAFELKTKSGQITGFRLAAETENPSFVCISPCKMYLYAVNELKIYEGKPQGSVSAYKIDKETGNLEFINKMPTGGTDPCHAVTSHSGEYLAVSNFMSGSMCFYKIREDGSIAPDYQLIQHNGSGTDPIRQTGPHVHAAMFSEDDSFVYVTDLGLDSVIAYRIDPKNGKLRKEHAYSAKPGIGPRYSEKHPDRDVCYTINELDSSVSALKLDPGSGELAHLQTVPTVEDSLKSRNTGSIVHISRDGRHVYASNRGHDSIAIFKTDVDGLLEYTGFEHSGGKTPRHFALSSSGDFLLAANQDSDNISVFRIDQSSGKLEKCSEIEAPMPVCVCEL